MAIYQDVQVKVAAVAGDTDSFFLTVGSETYTISRTTIKAMLQGKYKDPLFLVHQIMLKIDASGFDLNNATAAQLKAGIEALTLKW